MPTEGTSAKLRRFIKHLQDTGQQWSNDVEVIQAVNHGDDSLTVVTVTHWDRSSPEPRELHKCGFATGVYSHGQDEPLLRALTLAFGEVPELPTEDEE